MAAKQKCQICGQPAVGRYCYTHLGESLDASRQLYEQSPSDWKRQVDQANLPETEKDNYAVPVQV